MNTSSEIKPLLPYLYTLIIFSTHSTQANAFFKPETNNRACTPQTTDRYLHMYAAAAHKSTLLLPTHFVRVTSMQVTADSCYEMLITVAVAALGGSGDALHKPTQHAHLLVARRRRLLAIVTVVALRRRRGRFFNNIAALLEAVAGH